MAKKELIHPEESNENKQQTEQKAENEKEAASTSQKPNEQTGETKKGREAAPPQKREKIWERKIKTIGR